MNNSLKKILAGISAVAMLTVAVPFSSAFADDEAPEDSVTDTDTPGDNTEDTDGEGEDGEGEDTDGDDDGDDGDDDGDDGDDGDDTDKPVIDYSQVEKYETEEATIEYVVFDDSVAVITDVDSVDKAEITVPEKIEDYTVVGIADFAFATVKDDVVINVPDTLELKYMGSEAFVTSDVISKAIGVGTSVDEVIDYWLGQVSPDTEYTDAQIRDAVQRAYNKIAGAQVVAPTVELTAMSTILAVRSGDIEVSQKNLDRMNLGLSLLSYEGVKLVVASDEETPAIKSYADAKIDLECEVVAKGPKYPLGDVNRNGRLDTNDAIMVAKFIIGSIKFDEEQLELAKYTGTGKIDTNVVIALAKAIAKEASKS